MEEIKVTAGRTISEWEYAVDNRRRTQLVTVYFFNGRVCGANGIVGIGGSSYPAKWLSDGRCFVYGRRSTIYDIIF